MIPVTEDIPETVERLLSDDELQNIRERRGWATGTVVLIEDGVLARRIEDAFIELFNDEGVAGNFGGVRFLADDGDGLEEAYAYATQDAFAEADGGPGWYVEEYTDPENPNVGRPAP